MVRGIVLVCLGGWCECLHSICWAFSQSKAQLSLELFAIWLQLQHGHIQFSIKDEW